MRNVKDYNNFTGLYVSKVQYYCHFNFKFFLW